MHVWTGTLKKVTKGKGKQRRRRKGGGGEIPSVPSLVWDLCYDDLQPVTAARMLYELLATHIGNEGSPSYQERGVKFPERARKPPIPSSSEQTGRVDLERATSVLGLSVAQKPKTVRKMGGGWLIRNSTTMYAVNPTQREHVGTLCCGGICQESI